jgi:radical SAM protein with 4Fe4S-binding SPASM domain
LVYSGRGLDNLKIDITAKQRRVYVEYIINKAFEYYKDGEDIDLVTGNMEMDAVLLLKKFEQDYPDFVDSLTTKLKAWGGNSAGNRLGNMDWEGNVKPDPFFPKYLGNYLQVPFEDIWAGKTSDLVEKLRKSPREISGKCQDCKYLDICNGGSRSRAYAIYDDLWAEDPSCYLTNSEIKK